MNESPQQQQQPINPPSRNLWLPITLAVVGGAVLLGAVATAAVAGVNASLQNRDGAPQQLSLSAEGITEVEVDAAAANLIVECSTGATGDFELTTGIGSQQWEMRQSGDTLRVAPVKNWINVLPFIGGNPFTEPELVTFTMPASACDGKQPLDADFEIGAGELDITGAFRELDLGAGAGRISAAGSAWDVSVDVAAGEGEFELQDVRTASISVAAGDLNGRFTGTAPSEIEIEVAVGDATLELPDERYAVTSEVAVGDFENRLLTDPNATAHRISVEVAAGSLTLLPGSSR